MSQSDFNLRLQRLADKQVFERQDACARGGSPFGQKAASRQERLARSLMILERNGVAGAFAYAPLFQAMARVGLGPKPLFYWSWAGLLVFGFLFFCLIMGGTAAVAVALGEIPRPVQAMIELGPNVFLIVTSTLAALFAGVHKFKAAQMGLPRWDDL